MKKYLLFLLLITSNLFSQDLSGNIKYGIRQIYDFSGNSLQSKLITIPERIDGKTDFQNSVFDFYNPNASYLRWSFMDPVAINDYIMMSANGQYGVVSWGLNSKRISLYGNGNNTPIWEYTTSNEGWFSPVAISDTAGYIAVSAYHNILLFTRQNNVPVFNFDLTTLSDTGIAGAIDITSNGKFFICSSNRTDSSSIFGFNTGSSIPVWKVKVQTQYYIEGINISGNDSVVVISNINTFWVFNTFTGILRYQGTTPFNNQTTQGISGDGSVIAIVDHHGYLRTFQWNGSTYNLLWQHQEPPGVYYNWMTSVDVSYDGTLISCGTLNFLTASTFDGKVKLFNTTNSTPIWTYAGLGDLVTAVAFSKNAKILTAASWGDIANANNDFVAFKVPGFQSTPIYTYNTPGSLYTCSISGDGSSVITGGKGVHARVAGNGGELYNIFIDTTSGASGVNNNNSVPLSFKLYQNYPNPFNNQTRIEFDIPKSGFYKISVFDILGREVKELVNDNYKEGNYSVLFNGENFSSGIYYYKISSDKFIDVKRMLLVK
ncbi:MAG TPA: T9SS type A sorting domain-containing protein [Ignavibacteria bacterium]